MWEGLLDRPHIRAALGPAARARGPPHGVADPGPRRRGRRSLAGRVLLAGDAAMATDVMTGEGIGQALLTGRLAAEAIIAGGALAPDAVADDYRGRGAPPPRRRPPDVGAPRSCPRPPPRGSGSGGDPRPRRRRGAGATSPGGCSRTSRAPSRSRRRAGTVGCWLARAPSPERRGAAAPARGSRTSTSSSGAPLPARRGRTPARTLRHTRPTGRRHWPPAGSPGRAPPTPPTTPPTARHRRGPRARASPIPRGGRAGADRRTRPAAR